MKKPRRKPRRIYGILINDGDGSAPWVASGWYFTNRREAERDARGWSDELTKARVVTFEEVLRDR